MNAPMTSALFARDKSAQVPTTYGIATGLAFHNAMEVRNAIEVVLALASLSLLNSGEDSAYILGYGCDGIVWW